MTQANQIKKSDGFKFVMVFRIEGQNSHAIIFRIVGIAAALIAVGAKVFALFIARAP